MSDSSTNHPFSFDVHVKTPAPSPEKLQRIEELRSLLDNTGSDSYLEYRKWCSDDQLNRFLVARGYDVRRAYDLILTALKWRVHRRPELAERIDGWAERMSKEAETGKIYCPGSDRWGRPVIVFDGSVQNTNNSEDHMDFLAWNLEFAIHEMPPMVDKYLIFMHLENFSLWNNPSFAETSETIHMLCDCFPERLGHCVCYQAPMIFHAVFEAVKMFVDPKTASKITFLSGDVSEGSANDLEMRKLIGDDWKILTGADQPVYKRNCSPGYRHEVFWPGLIRRVKMHQAKELAADDTLTFAVIDGSDTDDIPIVKAAQIDAEGDSSTVAAIAEMIFGHQDQGKSKCA